MPKTPPTASFPAPGNSCNTSSRRGPGVHVDSGFAAGSQVTHFYDPLLAKLIVHAEDRPSAIRRMQAALREFVIHGVTTNIDFLQAVMAHEDFRARRGGHALGRNAVPLEVSGRAAGSLGRGSSHRSQHAGSGISDRQRFTGGVIRSARGRGAEVQRGL